MYIYKVISMTQKIIRIITKDATLQHCRNVCKCQRCFNDTGIPKLSTSFIYKFFYNLVCQYGCSTDVYYKICSLFRTNAFSIAAQLSVEIYVRRCVLFHLITQCYKCPPPQSYNLKYISLNINYRSYFCKHVFHVQRIFTRNKRKVTKNTWLLLRTRFTLQGVMGIWRHSH